MPRLGGIAIYIGFLAALLVAMVIPRDIVLAHRGDVLTIRIPLSPRTDQAVLGILLGSTLLFLVGIWDDARGLNPALKFVLQLAGAAILIPFGLTMQFITHPLTGQIVALGPLGPLFTILWVVGVVNAMNFIDGVDGLASGIAAIAGTTLLLTALVKGDEASVLLAACLIGSMLGFLRHNFNPARIIMGDSGSMFVGYVLGGMSVMGLYKSYTALSLIVPLLALAVPIVGTAFAIVRPFPSGAARPEAPGARPRGADRPPRLTSPRNDSAKQARWDRTSLRRHHLWHAPGGGEDGAGGGGGARPPRLPAARRRHGAAPRDARPGALRLPHHARPRLGHHAARAEPHRHRHPGAARAVAGVGRAAPRHGPGAGRRAHLLRRRAGRLLPPHPHRPRRGRAAHRRQIPAVPGGDEPAHDLGAGRPALRAHRPGAPEPAARGRGRGGHRRHGEHGDRRAAGDRGARPRRAAARGPATGRPPPRPGDHASAGELGRPAAPDLPGPARPAGALS